MKRVLASSSLSLISMFCLAGGESSEEAGESKKPNVKPAGMVAQMVEQMNRRALQQGSSAAASSSREDAIPHFGEHREFVSDLSDRLAREFQEQREQLKKELHDLHHELTGKPDTIGGDSSPASLSRSSSDEYSKERIDQMLASFSVEASDQLSASLFVTVQRTNQATPILKIRGCKNPDAQTLADFPGTSCALTNNLTPQRFETDTKDTFAVINWEEGRENKMLFVFDTLKSTITLLGQQKNSKARNLHIIVQPDGGYAINTLIGDTDLSSKDGGCLLKQRFAESLIQLQCGTKTDEQPPKMWLVLHEFLKKKN